MAAKHFCGEQMFWWRTIFIVHIECVLAQKRVVEQPIMRSYLNFKLQLKVLSSFEIACAYWKKRSPTNRWPNYSTATVVNQSWNEPKRAQLKNQEQWKLVPTNLYLRNLWGLKRSFLRVNEQRMPISKEANCDSRSTLRVPLQMDALVRKRAS